MDFIKNPQTTIALTFLAHIIFGIDGVSRMLSTVGFLMRHYLLLQSGLFYKILYYLVLIGTFFSYAFNADIICVNVLKHILMVVNPFTTFICP